MLQHSDKLRGAKSERVLPAYWPRLLHLELKEIKKLIVSLPWFHPPTFILTASVVFSHLSAVTTVSQCLTPSRILAAVFPVVSDPHLCPASRSLRIPKESLN